MGLEGPARFAAMARELGCEVWEQNFLALNRFPANKAADPRAHVHFGRRGDKGVCCVDRLRWPSKSVIPGPRNEGLVFPKTDIHCGLATLSGWGCPLCAA